MGKPAEGNRTEIGRGARTTVQGFDSYKVVNKTQNKC